MISYYPAFWWQLSTARDLERHHVQHRLPVPLQGGQASRLEDSSPGNQPIVIGSTHQLIGRFLWSLTTCCLYRSSSYLMSINLFNWSSHQVQFTVFLYIRSSHTKYLTIFWSMPWWFSERLNTYIDDVLTGPWPWGEEAFCGPLTGRRG